MTEAAPALTGAMLARCTFPIAGTAVTCAVSGGADSTALLLLAAHAGLRVTAVHVDHDLRPGSAGEAGHVERTAERVGAAFRSVRVDVGPGPNLEARAREARAGVLPADALTGHTADDRAETVLLNLLRGSGPTGMRGIARSPRRPLLDLRRRDTEALCAAWGIEPLVDPSNADPAHRRNRVRHELLPLLADIGERDPVPLLVRQADLFAALDGTVDRLAAQVDVTSARELREADPPVAGAAIRAWLAAAGVDDGHPAGSAVVDRVLAVARGDTVATEVAGGWRVARRRGRLELAPPGPCKDSAHG